MSITKGKPTRRIESWTGITNGGSELSKVPEKGGPESIMKWWRQIIKEEDEKSVEGCIVHATPLLLKSRKGMG